MQFVCKWYQYHLIYIPRSWSVVHPCYLLWDRNHCCCGPSSRSLTLFLWWLSELKCFGLEDEVVMGKQEVDFHRLQSESGLTQLYWPTPYSSQFSSIAQLSFSLFHSVLISFFFSPMIPHSHSAAAVCITISLCTCISIYMWVEYLLLKYIWHFCSASTLCSISIYTSNQEVHWLFLSRELWQRPPLSFICYL